jgi:hypothetical protein
MKSIQFVTGTTLDLRNVIAIDGGNAYLFFCVTSDVGKKFVIDIGRRRKMPFYVKEMYLILHFKEHCEIERMEPGEINLCNYIRSKGYNCRSLDYCDDGRWYKENLFLNDNGFGVFSENGLAIQTRKCFQDFYQVLIVPHRRQTDAVDFRVDYDFIDRYRDLIKKFLTEPDNCEQNYHELRLKAIDNS